MHKKLYNWLRLIVLSLLTMVSNITYAYDFEVDGIYYNIIASDQVEVTYRSYGDGSYSGNLQIPEIITYNNIKYSVTKISDHALEDCSGLTSVTIPNSVITIGWLAFFGCHDLTSITIPNSVTFIKSRAFHDTAWYDNQPDGVVYAGKVLYSYKGSMPNDTKIDIEEGTLGIAGSAFYQCRNLTSVTIPNSVTSIGDQAFADCDGLTSIAIPISVTSIEYRAFFDCWGLTSIKVESGNSVYDSRGNCHAIIETASNTLIFGCRNTVIPYGVTSIGKDAFSGYSRLTSITIPNSVTYIGGAAFFGCWRLTSITIPNSVTSIDRFAFCWCYGLTSITIPNSVTYLGEKSFYECTGLTSINIGSGIEYIDSQVFAGCPGLKDVYCYAEKLTDIDPEENETDGLYTNPNAFEGSCIEYATLHVPKGCLDAYKAQEPWNKFNSILAIEDSKTYSLSITATGNGSATFDGTTIRGKTQAFTVNEGTKATIAFTPDDGYQIKSLKVNNVAVTASTSYTATINSDASVEVEFEAIPDIPKTYTLSIRAMGNGIATYNGETIRETTKTYTLEEGNKVSMTFTPDEGNRIKGLRVNGEYQTVTDKYEATINADTSIKIDFEEIPVDPEPPVTYTLSIKAIGNGTATYDEEVIRDNTSTFTLNEGTTGTIAFAPDEDYHIKSLMVNGSAISIDTSYSFTMNSDISVEVEFEETVVDKDFTIDGINYEIISFDEHTLMVKAGDYGLILVIPDKIIYQDEEWTITDIVEEALQNCEDLAAIIWNPSAPFTAHVTNPNLLLYVKDEAYAPADTKNVVVNGFAKAITLIDAQRGNNFYCPEAFIAQSIVYTHNYGMKTGLNESRGWETISLPFDVQQIVHSSKGEITPFALWTSGGSTKPFWLYELSGSGFVEAGVIKANTPYIISMPNNENYPNDYQLSGRVTFSALNAEVKKSDEVQSASFGSITFIPSFINHDAEAGYYALNVNNDFVNYEGSENEGSKFILGLRKIHPFEAYMTSTSGTRSIDISEGMTTGIKGIEEVVSSPGVIKVYDLSGRLIKYGASMDAIRQELPSGVYIINNKKMIIK